MTTSNFCAYSWLLFVPILYSWPFFLATHFGSCARLVEHKNAYLAITLIVCLDGLIWNPASSTPVLCLSVSISVIHFSGLRQRWEGAVSHSTVLPLSVWLSRQNRSTSTNRIVSLKLPESMTCLVPAWQWPRQLAPRVHYRPQWLPTWGGGFSHLNTAEVFTGLCDWQMLRPPCREVARLMTIYGVLGRCESTSTRNALSHRARKMNVPREVTKSWSQRAIHMPCLIHDDSLRHTRYSNSRLFKSCL